MKSIWDLKEAARLLEIVPVAKKKAMSRKEIAERFFDKRGSDIEGGKPLTGSEIRKVQRYLENLSQPKNSESALIKLVAEKSRDGLTYNRRTYRYWQEPSALNKLLMTENNALDLILAQQILQRSFAGVLAERSKTASLDTMAESVVNMDVQTRRLRACLRVVPDWFGRIPAEIKPEILTEVINAIAANRQLQFEYKSPEGEAKTYIVSPRGLVAKDWSIYLISTEGLSDKPGRAKALHRMTSAFRTNKPIESRLDNFNLDSYIESTNQLSHALGVDTQPLQLKIKVHPKTIYHFKERPLSKDQVITDPKDKDGWHLVEAPIVETILLVPFLLSMGEGVNVIGPEKIRIEIAEKLSKMINHYRHGYS